MTNITRRSNGMYYAEIKVPAALRPVIGKSKLIQSLKTRDKRKAVVEAAPILKQFYAQLEAAETGPDAYAAVLARGFADVYATPRDEPIDEFGYTQAERNLEGFLDSLPDDVQHRYRRGVPFLANLNAYEDTFTKLITAKECRRYMRELVDYIPTLDPKDLKKRNVMRWLDDETMKAKPRAVRTMQKGAGFGAEYFEWLVQKGYVSDEVENPFKGLRFPKTLARVEGYIPLTLSEILAVRDASVEKGDNELTAYIDVARYTGMRISEVAALSSDSVQVVDGVECFRVKPDAKTKASSNRLVPIAKSLEKLMKASGYSLESFNLGNRHVQVSKRFGRTKMVVLEDGHDRHKCFHSIRKYVVTTLERAGVPEGITADLVGHDKPTMTYGTYSAGSTAKQLSGAVKKLEAAQK